MVTWLPGCSLYCPSTTTCSLAVSPESISAWPSLICATLTGRICHRAVGIDDVGVGSLLALLHGRRRDGQAVVPRIEQQPHIDEFARPKPVRRVGKFGLEPDRAGGLQDLVVDQRELAFVELDRVVLAVGEHRERPLGHLLLLNLRQVGLRQA